ncbi:alpha/beta hydrolase, partial [Acinetobacter baumannii]|nr:alpha/beta hydrolase [Acinetobacter baumannii]
HSRIVLSQNAAKEVWPTILQWIDKNSKEVL